MAAEFETAPKENAPDDDAPVVGGANATVFPKPNKFVFDLLESELVML